MRPRVSPARQPSPSQRRNRHFPYVQKIPAPILVNAARSDHLDHRHHHGLALFDHLRQRNAQPAYGGSHQPDEHQLAFRADRLDPGWLAGGPFRTQERHGGGVIWDGTGLFWLHLCQFLLALCGLDDRFRLIQPALPTRLGCHFGGYARSRRSRAGLQYFPTGAQHWRGTRTHSWRNCALEQLHPRLYWRGGYPDTLRVDHALLPARNPGAGSKYQTRNPQGADWSLPPGFQ